MLSEIENKLILSLRPFSGGIVGQNVRGLILFPVPDPALLFLFQSYLKTARVCR